MLLDFLTWSYSARDHKDLLKRGLFSTLVGSRSSFLTGFWLNKEILDQVAVNASKGGAISPLLSIMNHWDFASKLYEVFFTMALQIAVRALTVREGGVELTSTGSSSSLQMPSLDRYQSSIDQNQTEALLNWILNFVLAQTTNMGRLLEHYEHPLQSARRAKHELKKRE